MPGTMRRTTSLRIVSNGSPSSGGCAGSCARTAPGFSSGATRNDSIFSRKSAIQSASSCNCLRNSSGGVSRRLCGSFISDAGNPASKYSRRKRTLTQARLPAPHQSKGKTKAEMKRAEIFVWARIGINAVIEANRTHGQLVAQAGAYGVAHIVETNVFRRRQKVAGMRAKCNRGLPEPPLKWRARGLIYHYTRREWLGAKWKIITNAHRTADKFDIAPERARGHLHRVANEEPAWVHIRTLTHIKCVSESDRIYEITAWTEEKFRFDLGIGDLHM